MLRPTWMIRTCVKQAICALTVGAACGAAACSAPAAARRDSSQVPSAADAERQVRQIEEIEWARASRAKDTVWFARHLADELIVTTGRTGRVTSKREEMADILNPTMGGGEDRLEELRVRSYGQVAVATFRLVSTGTDRTGPYHRTARYTEVWVHRDGRWQLAASHSSLIPAAGQ